MVRGGIVFQECPILWNFVNIIITVDLASASQIVSLNIDIVETSNCWTERAQKHTLMDVTVASERWQYDSNRYGNPVISIVDTVVVFTRQFTLMTRDYLNPNPYLFSLYS